MKFNCTWHHEKYTNPNICVHILTVSLFQPKTLNHMREGCATHPHLSKHMERVMPGGRYALWTCSLSQKQGRRRDLLTSRKRRWRVHDARSRQATQRVRPMHRTKEKARPRRPRSPLFLDTPESEEGEQTIEGDMRHTCASPSLFDKCFYSLIHPQFHICFAFLSRSSPRGRIACPGD
jgi:hypothetical protein